MRPLASDRLPLIALALLALSSLGLKAAAGPPRDGFGLVVPGSVERQLERGLRSQHFSTQERMYAHRSSLILATRGQCTLALRDARDGVAGETVFARDTQGIGTPRYYYRGRRYDDPPTFAMRFGRLESELADRLGLNPPIPVAVAVAASRSCGDSAFGLDDVQLDV